MTIKGFLIFCFFIQLNVSCPKENVVNQQTLKEINTPIKVGAENSNAYYPLLKGKKIGCVVNHTSIIAKKHLVDTLLLAGFDIQKIYTPEHGLKGTADAGEHVENGMYKEIPIISLYGDNKKPQKEQLHGIDLMLFDMQDVGIRFFTYISTLHYVMEACAENNIPLLVLDRPNPHAHYVDGPVLISGYESFIGMHHVPVCYGMTIGEYGKMINEEGWLKNKVQCPLKVIPCLNYDRDHIFEISVKPSPNLPNSLAIQLYPSICLFEGTVLSLGRGTNKQFQVVGHPSLKGSYSFTPLPNEGAKDPVLNGQLCFGEDYSQLDVNQIFQGKKLDISYIMKFYNNFEDKGGFFLKNKFFDKLAGTNELRNQIIAGKSEDVIRKSWQTELNKFVTIRKKYLIYE